MSLRFAMRFYLAEKLFTLIILGMGLKFPTVLPVVVNFRLNRDHFDFKSQRIFP